MASKQEEEVLDTSDQDQEEEEAGKIKDRGSVHRAGAGAGAATQVNVQRRVSPMGAPDMACAHERGRFSPLPSFFHGRN